MLRLMVSLPRQRSKLGTLRLVGEGGEELFAGIPCYGKADSARAQAGGNPERDSTRPYGDTPSGRYAPAKVVRFEPAHPRLGRLAIPLDGLAGDALLAKERGRTGLALHAGRGRFDPNRRDHAPLGLVATYGCLRLADDHLESLARLIGDAEVEVVIEDI